MGDKLLRNIVKVKRERGRGFPKLSLSSAIEVIEKASKYGRQWTREQFAIFGSKASVGSAKSGAFLNRLAALKDFGLINTTGAIITRTELADQIVKPVKPEERETAIKQAFLNVDTFRAIIETVSQKVDLAKNDIAEMAVKQLGVTRNVKDIFVSSFVESGKFAGIITEIDENTIQTSLQGPTSEQRIDVASMVEGESPDGERNLMEHPLTETASTSFNTKRMGKTWDVSVQVRYSRDVNTELINKVIKLIQDAEEIAKSFNKSEENNAHSDNKS